ncbi:MAG: rod shape-determining protein MreC [Armatimonadota bacterium]
MHGARERWEPVLIMLVLAAIMTVGQHRARGAGGVSVFERVARHAVWPVQSGLVAVGTVLDNIKTAALLGGRLARENEELRRRVADLESERIAMYGYYLENRAMKAKLGWDGATLVSGIPARVIDWTSDPSRRRITIEASVQIERGMIVRTAAGLVGRVIEAEGTRGTVVLLLDADHAVAAKILREGGDLGMIYAAPQEHQGKQMLLLDKLPHGADVRVGDRVVSSGLGQVYPAGLPIGVVERVERSEVNAASIVAYVKPYADMDHLDYVLVIPRGG